MLYGILLPLIVFSKSLNRNSVSVARPSEIPGHMSNQSPSQLTKLLIDAHRNKLVGKRDGSGLLDSIMPFMLMQSLGCGDLDLMNDMEMSVRDRVDSESSKRERGKNRASQLERCLALADVLSTKDGKDATVEFFDL